MSLGELGLTDASVPGVALIGDGDRLWQILAEAGERLIDRGYLRYKPGTSLVAGLRLASGHAFAYAVGAAAAAKPRKTVDRAPEGSVLCWSPANGLLIARAGADRDLPGLLRPDRLAAALPEGVRAARWETLAYKPQRRWVARPFESGRALPYVVRAYRRNDLPRALAGWDLATEVAARGAGLVLPRILVRARRGGIATTSWLPAHPWTGCSPAARSTPSCSSGSATSSPGCTPACPPGPGTEWPDASGPRGRCCARSPRCCPTIAPGPGNCC